MAGQDDHAGAGEGGDDARRQLDSAAVRQLAIDDHDIGLYFREGLDGLSRADAFTLLGREGHETITLEEMSAAAGTIPQELAVRLNGRLPRLYQSAAALRAPGTPAISTETTEARREP